MSAASERLEVLARVIGVSWATAAGLVYGLGDDEADALIKRLAEGDAAVTAVAVLTADLAIWRARAEKAEAERDAAVAASGLSAACRMGHHGLCVHDRCGCSCGHVDVGPTWESLHAAPAADHESGTTDG